MPASFIWAIAHESISSEILCCEDWCLVFRSNYEQNQLNFCTFPRNLHDIRNTSFTWRAQILDSEDNMALWVSYPYFSVSSIRVSTHFIMSSRRQCGIKQVEQCKVVPVVIYCVKIVG